MSPLYTLVAILVFAAYFMLPTSDRVRNSLKIYISQYSAGLRLYNRCRGPEELSKEFFGNTYKIPELLRKQLGPDDVVFLPPKDYLLKYLPPSQIAWAEPKYVYYWVGPICAIPWARSRRDVRNAQRWLRVDGRRTQESTGPSRIHR